MRGWGCRGGVTGSCYLWAAQEPILRHSRAVSSRGTHCSGTCPGGSCPTAAGRAPLVCGPSPPVPPVMTGFTLSGARGADSGRSPAASGPAHGKARIPEQPPEFTSESCFCFPVSDARLSRAIDPRGNVNTGCKGTTGPPARLGASDKAAFCPCALFSSTFPFLSSFLFLFSKRTF